FQIALISASCIMEKTSVYWLLGEFSLLDDHYVTLHCQDTRKVSIELIKWSKPDLKSDKYVYLFRDGSMCISCQHPLFHDRVELKDPEMKNGDASVILKNVTVNDTGTYECCVGHGQDVHEYLTSSRMEENGFDTLVVCQLLLLLLLLFISGF
uniref:Ig-like domain-containing protein n=1 Tax=Anabas testudineus TaxID=64144 RepID=A0A3Q1J6Q0_ANATE